MRWDYLHSQQESDPKAKAKEKTNLLIEFLPLPSLFGKSTPWLFCALEISNQGFRLTGKVPSERVGYYWDRALFVPPLIRKGCNVCVDMVL